MRSMPAGAGPRLEAGDRNASDSFGGGSGMPVLLPCPASLASAHAGGDTRAPPGRGATPGISAPCMPGHCRAHHSHAANRLPGFLLLHSATLASGGALTRIYCRTVIVDHEGQHINSQPRCCRGWGGWVGRSSHVAATRSTASPAPCI